MTEATLPSNSAPDPAQAFLETGDALTALAERSAAVDRLVHHATVLEFNVPSYRTRKRRKNEPGQAA